MKLKLILSAIVLCLATVPFAQTADSAVVQTPADSIKANPADSAFSKAYVSIEGGEMYPFGDLQDAVENSFYGGVGLRYSYWDDFDGFVHFNYAYVKVRAREHAVPLLQGFYGGPERTLGTAVDSPGKVEYAHRGLLH